jgi:hypothetical protein
MKREQLAKDSGFKPDDGAGEMRDVSEPGKKREDRSVKTPSN